MPHIRIFPAERSFPSREAFAAWLAQLRASGGEYHLMNAIAELPIGSVVLFRYADEIVGEGVVREYVRRPGAAPSPTGEAERHEASVSFAPGSIRFFRPPLPADVIQEVIGRDNDLHSEGGYCIIDRSLYLKLLVAHVRDRVGEFG
jgi:hypothetical protein